MPRVSASARTRATPPPPQSRAAPSARAPAGRMTRRTRSRFGEIGQNVWQSAYHQVCPREKNGRDLSLTSTLVATSLRVAP